MTSEYMGRDKMELLDELIINLVGLRTEFLFLDDLTINQILLRAKNDLIFITEGFRKCPLK